MKTHIITTIVAALIAGQAFALDAASSDSFSVVLNNKSQQPEQLTLPHSFVAEMQKHSIATIEHGVIRPFACTLKGSGVTAHITARGFDDAEWTLNALREQGASAKILATVDPDASEVTVTVTRDATAAIDRSCDTAFAPLSSSAPGLIELQHAFVRDFDTYMAHNFDNRMVMADARWLTAGVKAHITAQTQELADRVAFEYRRYGATAPFSTTIDPNAEFVTIAVTQ